MNLLWVTLNLDLIKFIMNYLYYSNCYYYYSIYKKHFNYFLTKRYLFKMFVKETKPKITTHN